ncbi:acetate--CoA ligase family protein [Actinophytocola sp.]|uniref:acetate--CoA ligase family protein n=1 Tax=Actinophytocola sp. TaxID=1872138 RepID=UPI0025C3F2A0|nr:acetate--CoA ligase family protein [Actinophytocola sp.]
MKVVDQASLSSMFNPQTVAVVGASENVGYGGYGGRVLRNLVRAGFTGNIVPVSPKYEEVQGLKAYRDIRDVPMPVDLAVLVVRAELIPGIMRACGEKGVPACSIVSAGFAERGDEGAALQREILAIAGEYGMRFSGPNCLGIANITEHVFASASSLAWNLSELRPGNVSIVSQSGAMAFNSVLARAHEHHVGIGKIATVGNQADLAIVDFLEYLIDHDEQTRVVSVLLEALLPGDGRRFLEAAGRAADAGKSVLALKVGRTSQGAAAAASHTGSLTGDDAIYDDCFEAAGVVRVNDLDELWQTGNLIASTSGMSGHGGIGVLSNSGGLNSLFADLCGVEELALASIDQTTVDVLREILQGFGSAANPADITGHIKRDTLRDMIVAYDRDENVNLTVIGITPSGSGPYAVGIARNIVAAQQTTKTPVVVLWASSRDLETAGKATTDDSGITILLDAGVPVFEEPRKCARALRHLYRRRRREAEPAAFPRMITGAPAQAEPATGASPLLRDNLLESIGAERIPVARSLVAEDWEATVAAAEQLGYPIVVKVHSPGVAHKTELGGVRVGIADRAELRQAYEDLTGILDRRGEPPRLLVQELVAGEVEVILGGVRDPIFGPVVMLGSGGILVELLRDRVFRPAPVDTATAHAMIRSLNGAPLLEGHRGRPRCDVDALADTIVRFSEIFAAAPELTELEINPLMVGKEGSGVRAVDALAVGGDEQVREPAEAGRR